MSATRERDRVRTIERARAAMTRIEQHPRPSVEVLGWARDQLNVTCNNADTHAASTAAHALEAVADALS